MIILLLLFITTALQPNQEIQNSLQTLHKADSLAMHHLPFLDSIALQNSIDVFNTQQEKYKKELSRTYYYLGHLYDETHAYRKEIKYLMLSLQTYSKDNLINGKIFMHFESICRNCNDLNAATYFGEKGVKYLKQTKDDYWYASALCILYKIYELKQEYTKADKILYYISQVPKDSISCTLYSSILAMKRYREQDYKSVINIMDSIFTSTIINNAYLLITYQFIIANAYKQINLTQEAKNYYKKIIETPIDDPIRIQAYDSLISITTKKEHIEEISLQELQNLKTRIENNQEEQAAAKILRNYLNKKIIIKQITITSICIIIVIALVIFLLSYFHKQNNYTKKEIAKITAKLEKDKEYKIDIINKKAEKHHKELSQNIIYGNITDENVKDFINQNFFLLADKLENYQKLNITEIKMCYLCLIGCTQQECADILFRSVKSIGSLKKRAAKKLNTTSSELRNFLIYLICNEETS